jgi:threonine/homoserine/homoserine lactone efflux protein
MDSPHLWAFYLAFLPQFVGPGDPPLARFAATGRAHIGIGVAWLATLAFAVGRIRPPVESRLRRARLEGAGGAVLIGLGVRLAAARR